MFESYGPGLMGPKKDSHLNPKNHRLEDHLIPENQGWKTKKKQAMA